MGNAAVASGATPPDVSTRKAAGVIGYKKIPETPGSTGKKDSQSSALTPADLQWKYYVKTYREVRNLMRIGRANSTQDRVRPLMRETWSQKGDPELPEDPAFPQRLVEKIQERDFPSDQSTSGAYIFYPDRSKPKMWVGQYRCLNPEDLLTCALEAGCTMGEVTGCLPTYGDGAPPETVEESDISSDKNEETGMDRRNSQSTRRPVTCSLMRSCLHTSTVEEEDSEQNLVDNLRGGQSYLPSVSPLEKQLTHAVLQNSMKQKVAVATGHQFAHENLSTRLNFAQNLFSNDLPAVLVGNGSAKELSNPGTPMFPRPGVGVPQAAAAVMPAVNSYTQWATGQKAPMTCHQQSPASHELPKTGQMQEQIQPCLLPPVLFALPTRSSAQDPQQPTLVQ